MSQPTEPWTETDRADGIHIVLAYAPMEGEDLPTICVVPWSDRGEADARRILRAVDSHDDLLTAPRAALEPLELYHAYGWPDRAGVRGRLRSAIEKAGGTE